jgi:cystathionine beta-lyase family protein involved in aluminum resistance
VLVPQVVSFSAMQVVKAVDSLYSEFRAVDSLVACNTARVLKAFQNARVGSHVSLYFI